MRSDIVLWFFKGMSTGSSEDSETRLLRIEFFHVFGVTLRHGDGLINFAEKNINLNKNNKT